MNLQINNTYDVNSSRKGKFSLLVTFRGIHENGQFGESYFKLPIPVNSIIWVRETFQSDISNKDCLCEGIIENEIITPKNQFIALWESIHGKESWNNNPWVYVHKFEQIEKPENFIK